MEVAQNIFHSLVPGKECTPLREEQKTCHFLPVPLQSDNGPKPFATEAKTGNLLRPRLYRDIKSKTIVIGIRAGNLFTACTPYQHKGVWMLWVEE